jgi:hypothetical protein
MSRAGWDDLWFTLGILACVALIVWGLRHGA